MDPTSNVKLKAKGATYWTGPATTVLLVAYDEADVETTHRERARQKKSPATRAILTRSDGARKLSMTLRCLTAQMANQMKDVEIMVYAAYLISRICTSV
jgi:hypothetical protein